MKFKELKKQSKMTTEQLSGYFNIPYSTVQSWDNGSEQCPEYLLDLMAYKLKMEKKKDELSSLYFGAIANYEESEAQLMYQNDIENFAEELNELQKECDERIKNFNDFLNR